MHSTTLSVWAVCAQAYSKDGKNAAILLVRRFEIN